jgi:hypothetical protein
MTNTISREELIETFSESLLVARVEREAFKSRWPIVLPLRKWIPRPETGGEMLRFEEAGQKATAWAAVHLGDHEVHNAWIGVRDPVDALWFRLRWH